MAAGNAARFGENKLAAMVNGKPLIEHALEAIPRESFSRVLVVTQHENVEAAAKKFGFEALRNEHPERGQSETIRLGTVYAVAIMMIGLLVFQLIPKELLLMFDASDAMLEIGAPALRIMSLAFIFAGISIVAGSSCQAFGYSVYSMLISIARQIVVLIPAAYLLSLTGVLRSIWFAFPIAEIFSLILCCLN